MLKHLLGSVLPHKNYRIAGNFQGIQFSRFLWLIGWQTTEINSVKEKASLDPSKIFCYNNMVIIIVLFLDHHVEMDLPGQQFVLTPPI